MSLPRLRPGAGVFLAYLALAVLASWPLALHLTDFVVGVAAPPGEATPPLNIWAMATVLDHLPFAPLRMFEGTAFYPYAHTLAFSEHLFVPALMAWPVVALTGNWVLAYNLVMLVTLATAGLGMYLLARELTGDGLASFAAGLLYAFHTWNINELVRSQITANQWFPFVVLALVRFFAAPSVRGAVLAGIAYLLQSLSCMYWALYLPFLVAATVLFLWWRHRPSLRSLGPLALSLGAAVAVTGLFAIPYVLTARELGFERPAPIPVLVQRFLQVMPENVLYGDLLGHALRNQNAAHFLGFSALALAAVALVRSRDLQAPGARMVPLLAGLVAAGFVLSLGPQIQWGDHVLGPGPYALLRRFVPGFRNVRYPERLSILLVLGLAPLVAIGLARLRPRLGPRGVAALAALVFLEHLSIPQQLSFLPAGRAIPEVYRWLREQKDVAAVAEVPASPFLMERADGLPMYLSIVHGKRLVQGYTSYFAPTYNFAKWRLYHFPSAESVAFLARFGVDAVVVAPEDGAPPAWAGPDPRWEVKGPFPGGHVVLRLKEARGQRYEPPPDDGAAFREIDRAGWQVQASKPGARLALDGDEGTAWTTTEQQEEGDYYRVRLAAPAPVARVALGLRSPFCFPMHMKLFGETPGRGFEEIPFDEPAVYDRLFASLLHEPRRPRLVVDLDPPRTLSALRIRVTETDPFSMRWVMSEIRLFARR